MGSYSSASKTHVSWPASSSSPSVRGAGFSSCCVNSSAGAGWASAFLRREDRERGGCGPWAPPAGSHPGQAGRREDASPSNYLGARSAAVPAAPRSTQPQASWGTPGPRLRCPKPQLSCRRFSQSDIPVPYTVSPCSPLPSPRSSRALLVLLRSLGNSWSLFDHSWSFPDPQFWGCFRLFRASLGIPSLLFFPRFWAS